MRTLDQWLDYQQLTHPRSVELGLDRVGEVWRRMGAPRPAPVVITVGGTNGKGSTVAFLEAMLAEAGKRVGCYTSPHLLRYNERVRVLGEDAGDAALVDAFERIEVARLDMPLTYFEFGTLAALWIFAQSGLDVAVLEVGLGGRLDAVNIIDADAAIVTTVDLDHQDWLGNDRESIGREKAGILRSAQPAIIGMRDPPASLLAEARRVGARPVRAGADYEVIRHAPGWQWQRDSLALDFPEPALLAPCQIDNAASAIAALYCLRDRLGWNPSALAAGIRAARVPARLQRMRKPGGAELIIDVAHNPQAARVLGEWLQRNPGAGASIAVFGALADKDIGGIVAALAPHIAQWHLGGLDADTPRGLPVLALRDRVLSAAPAQDVAIHQDIAAALSAAAAQASAADRILAFGSFFVAATALQWAHGNGWTDVEPAAAASKV
jgi:dihydrofolate synthase / folylpolyglutamate synthase